MTRVGGGPLPGPIGEEPRAIPVNEEVRVWPARETRVVTIQVPYGVDFRLPPGAIAASEDTLVGDPHRTFHVRFNSDSVPPRLRLNPVDAPPPTDGETIRR